MIDIARLRAAIASRRPQNQWWVSQPSYKDALRALALNAARRRTTNRLSSTATTNEE